MSSVSSEDSLEPQSERFESYSLCADVNESESSSTSVSSRLFNQVEDSSSLTSSPIKVTSPVVHERRVYFSSTKTAEPESGPSEIQSMKERFAKLLLGEDMSGGGKGVCTALAISNAITNLSATVFGGLWRLEPLEWQKKLMWYREMEWLLSVSDSIVELTSALPEFPSVGTFEVMVSIPQSDLRIILPALKKLDAMLLSILDGFCDSDEFYYVDRGVIVPSTNETNQSLPRFSTASGRPSIRLEEKWWLPFPMVLSPKGLSQYVRKRLLQCRDCTNQIFKASLAINNSILAEMEIPSIYLDNLPKSVKTSLGETLYRFLTTDQFSAECFLDYLDGSFEYNTLDIANRIEAAAQIWRQKYHKLNLVHGKSGKSSWGSKVKGFVGCTEKCKRLAHRAETLLHNLRIRFPSLPQTALDISKIEYNKDVGKSILESYSRVIESLAFNITARIDDLIYVDNATKQAAVAESMSSLYEQGSFGSVVPKQKSISPSPISVQPPSCSSAITLPAFHSSAEIVIASPGGMEHHSNLNKSNPTYEDEKVERLFFS